jgi:hypothetical protein
LRVLQGNLINCCASLNAIAHYARSRIRREPLVWIKTEHAYPQGDALPAHQRTFADVLTGSGYMTEEQLTALGTQLSPDGDLPGFLLQTGALSDEELCKIISLQSGLPWTRIDPNAVKPRVARSIPVHLGERFGIVPFGFQDGRLLVAGPRVPPSALFEELQQFTRLHVEFQLIPQHNYNELKNRRSASS